MRIWRRSLTVLVFSAFAVLAVLILVHVLGAKESPGVGSALTIYNRQFAVVRQLVPLDLKAGANHVEVTDISAHVEPDSVFLRSLEEGRKIRILEQNYRNDPVTQQLLLSLYEGKTIDFDTVTADGKHLIVQGKIIRSGFVPHSASAFAMYGQEYYQQQMAAVQGGSDQPIIEVSGKLQFSLPGQPVFPALADDTVLKPTLAWDLAAEKSGATPAELSYVTGGMNWAASYNLVAPAKGDQLEMVGWVTLDNQSGKTFHDAHIKLMAGDVHKLQPGVAINGRVEFGMASLVSPGGGPAVTEKALDEYHLYNLENPTTLHDRETKQVEFVRATGIQSKTIYVYDGLKVDPNYVNWPMENIRQQESYGTLSNPKVWVVREFKNSSENHLGIPLPKGRLRFYRRDDDGQLEFTGEDQIDHSPKDETIRTYTGSAFDITGERHRLNYKADMNGHWVEETFEIKLRNHKTTPVDIRVVEHLYRWMNWEITVNSDPFTNVDSQTVAFPISVPADGEKTLKYQVHYSW